MTSGVAQAATAATATGAAQAADTAKAVDASLTRSELTAPGIRRRRSGRGFRYFAVDGVPLADAEALARIKALVIPPAGKTCGSARVRTATSKPSAPTSPGAASTGTNDRWRDQQDREKFDRMLEFGRALPRVRTTSEQHLRGRELCHKGEIRSSTRESGKRHVQTVDDDLASPVVRSLEYAATAFPTAMTCSFSAWEPMHRRITAENIERLPAGHIRRRFHRQGLPHLARDRARRRRAGGLAGGRIADRAQARHRPRCPGGGRIPGEHSAVARASYIDPRVIARYEDSITIASSLADLGQGREFGDVATKGQAEQALLKLLSSDLGKPARV